MSRRFYGAYFLLPLLALIPRPSLAMINMGGGLWCQATEAYVDGQYQSTYYDHCVFISPGGSPGGDPPSGDPLGPPQCAPIIADRPADCTDRVSKPEGSAFGAEHYQLGSALQRSIALEDVLSFRRSNAPNFVPRITGALADQTLAIATMTGERHTINMAFYNNVRDTCSDVRMYFNLLRARGGMFAPDDSPAGPEIACRNDVMQIAREMGSPSLVQSTLNAFDWIGFDLSDLVPSSLINWLSPENSLHQKWKLVPESVAPARIWRIPASLRSAGPWTSGFCGRVRRRIALDARPWRGRSSTQAVSLNFAHGRALADVAKS